jgi:LacI family transcriptional regulator
LIYPVINSVLEGIRETLHAAGFNMNLMAARTQPTPQMHFSELFTAAPIIDVAHIDAAIVIDLPGGHMEPLYTLARHLPVCSLAHFLYGPGLSCVLVNYGMGTFSALRYLYHSGHRYVVLVTPNDCNNAARQQREGLVYAAAAFPGLRAESLILPIDIYAEEWGRETANMILNQKDRPTAVIFGSDELLSGFMEIALKKGIKIPEELSVVGWNDTLSKEKFGIAFSTLACDRRTQGKLAAESVLEMLSAPEKAIDARHIPMTLISRESTASI